MKKQGLPVLILVTAIFLAFLLGFFFGRTQTSGGIWVSVPASMQTVPPETTLITIAEEPELSIVFPININTASAEELMALPGIGEVLADRILAYREANGSFSAVEGLMNVEGIGEKRMEEIWDLVTLGGAA